MLLNTPWELLNTIVNGAISFGFLAVCFWLIGSLVWDLLSSPFRKHRADVLEVENNRLRAENAQVHDLEWRIKDAQWQIDYAEENLEFYRNWLNAHLPEETKVELTKDWCEWSEARSRRRSRETTFGPYLIADQRDDGNEGGAPAQAVPA